jgi:hypothetical protein
VSTDSAPNDYDDDNDDINKKTTISFTENKIA